MPRNTVNTGTISILAILVLLSGCGAQSSNTDETPCESYPVARAEELITNSDTGRRKIEGQILATAAVKSKDTFTNGRGQEVPIYVIAINVDGQIVVVLLGSDSPTGPGMYSSTDDLSQRATSFPQNSRIGDSSTEGVSQARACVTKS